MDDSTRTDTLLLDSAAAVAAVTDTAVAGAADTLAARVTPPDEDEEFDLFGFGEAKDTTPVIMARDTMKVPDSLKYINPFLYKWYVATKDSLTHRIVVDSLKAEGDSLDWPVIDSLYILDSTTIATEKFNRWYASLTKAERKRYDYEQQLPAILHRLDSIQAVKDSIKRRKDSIIENTPRILETAFLPDSMFYKRLVTWRHDPRFNSIETFGWDTTANYHFEDYPYMRQDLGGTFLGMPGSAVETYNFFQRGNPSGTVSFYAPYESWTHSPSSIPMFNTKTPYTELEYSGNLFNSKTTASDNFRVFTTQNILPSLNVALEFKRYGGAGRLKNEATSNTTTYITGNYLGKRYLAHAGFISNSISRSENGGIRDRMWIRDTLVDVREIDVRLEDAKNTYRKKSLFFDQSFRIPLSDIRDFIHRNDTSYVRADTLNVDQMTTFIGTSTEWTSWSKMYTDGVTATVAEADTADFFNDAFFINPNKSADSMRVSLLENRVFARFQPWHEDAVVSKIEGGVGSRILSHFNQGGPDAYLHKQQKERWNSAYLYAGVEGRLQKYIDWNAVGEYTFAGTQANDFSLQANARLNIFPFRRQPGSPISLKASFATSLKEPGYYEKTLYTNHFNWDNQDFSKVSTSSIRASIDIPRWKFHAGMGYALLANNIWYDTLGIVRQNTSPMSILSVDLEKDFALGILHLDNKALFQLSSDPDVVPLPALALNLRWYLQFTIVREDVLKLQMGVNSFYNTLWYAPAYNPVAGVFHNQNKQLYGNAPRFDIFINAQWKKCCIFLKYENAGRGWPLDARDYFSADGYIYPPASLKFGISWPFYPTLGKTRTLSSQAGGAMGGGGRSGSSGGRSSGGLSSGRSSSGSSSSGRRSSTR